MAEQGLDCIICDKRLYNIYKDIDNQPDNGTTFTSRGNYGSTVWDTVMGEMFLMINICDDCLKEKAEKVFMGQDYRIVTSCGDRKWPGAAIGRMRIERELVTFNPDVTYSDEEDVITVESLEEFDELTAERDSYDQPLVTWPQGIAFARSIVEHDLAEEESWQDQAQHGQGQSHSE